MKFFTHMKKQAGGFVASLKLKYDNVFNKIADGEIFVKIYDNGVLIEEKSLGHNIVTKKCSTLLARLVKNPLDPVAGVSFFAVGTGNPSWDKFNPPAPLDTAENLEAEIERITPTRSLFIDPSTGLESLTPTNVVDWDFDFLETQAVGFLVECGLLGGDANADKLISYGDLVTFKTFPVISKTSTMTISFTYRLTF